MKKINLFILFAISTHIASANVISFPAVANTKNPCSGENIIVHGITTLSIHETTKGVLVSENFTGVENGYSVNYSGNSTFEEIKKIYPIEINGSWKSSSNSFSSTSIDNIFSSNGIHPTGDKFQEMNNSCE